MNKHTSEQDNLIQRLQGRIDYLLKIKRVKDPELMMSAVEFLTELIDASKCLLADMGEPDDSAEAYHMGRLRNVIARATGEAE